MLSTPLALALALTLSLGPAPDVEGDATATLATTLEQVGTVEPSQSIAELEQALAAAAQQPQLAADADAQATLAEARLVLAYLFLAEGNEAKAAAAMDEALRSAHDAEVQAGKFGPTVLELHDARKAVLADGGSAALEIDCAVDCAVIVNESTLAGRSASLPLGRYRVWISATEGDPAWAFHEVELDAADTTRTIEFAGPARAVPVEDAPVDEPKTRKRMLPRWAEIVGMTAGLGLAAGGAVFMALNGRCKDGSNDTSTCPQIYDNTIQGVSLLAAGGAVFVTFGALLTVDEVRVGRAKGRQAMLHWSMRF